LEKNKQTNKHSSHPKNTFIILDRYIYYTAAYISNIFFLKQMSSAQITHREKERTGIWGFFGENL
jgi:hypothetical protein